MRQHRMPRRGFSLLEVLIALLIFSLGLLGMAGLMVVSVKTNQSAYLRTQTSFLAQSMTDRIRANIAHVNDYNGTYSDATAGADPCADGAACTPEAIVDRDTRLWSRQLADSLPNAEAEIECDGASLGVGTQIGSAPYDGLCTFTIRWDEAELESDAAADPAEQTFAWVFQP